MRAAPHADPARGVFETMLVLAGRPVELDAHLDRLGASLAALFGAATPVAARSAAVEEARRIGRGKLRLTVSPAEGTGRLRTEILATALDPDEVFPAAGGGVRLRSFAVPGGFGAHKWADRSLLERAAAAARPGELPLLVDADGTALEAVRANIFLAGEGWLATPPGDGRILPGIARRQAIEIAEAAGVEVRERRLGPDDLRAGEVFLAGSVRGVEPVRALDGVGLASPGEVSALVAAGLRRRWLPVPREEPAAVGAGGPRAGRHAR